MSTNGVELTVTEKLKNLGLIFDCSLSWAYHVASVCINMSYYLYCLVLIAMLLTTKMWNLLPSSVTDCLSSVAISVYVDALGKYCNSLH